MSVCALIFLEVIAPNWNPILAFNCLLPKQPQHSLLVEHVNKCQSYKTRSLLTLQGLRSSSFKSQILFPLRAYPQRGQIPATKISSWIFREKFVTQLKNNNPILLKTFSPLFFIIVHSFILWKISIERKCKECKENCVRGRYPQIYFAQKNSGLLGLILDLTILKNKRMHYVLYLYDIKQLCFNNYRNSYCRIYILNVNLSIYLLLKGDMYLI